MSNTATVHYGDKDVTYKNLCKPALFKFHMGPAAVWELKTEDMLSESADVNAEIVTTIVQMFQKTFTNNASINFGNGISCTGNNVAKIDICDGSGRILATALNRVFI